MEDDTKRTILKNLTTDKDRYELEQNLYLYDNKSIESLIKYFGDFVDFTWFLYDNEEKDISKQFSNIMNIE